MDNAAPAPDAPGYNTTLRPARSPRWMRPLIQSMTPGTRRVRGVLGNDPRAPQRAVRTQAAVLVLISGAREAEELPEDAGVVLTHRSPRMRSHAGQMAFPGGKVDPQDDDVVDCALREAWEEVGLDRRSVTPLARMGSLHVRSNRNPVHPVIAYWDEPAELYPTSPEETDDVFVAPVRELVDPSCRITVAWKNYRGPAFRVRDYLVWGFTAGVLDAVLEVAGWARDWDQERTVDLYEELGASRNQESGR